MDKKITYLGSRFLAIIVLSVFFISPSFVDNVYAVDASITREQEQIQFLISNLKKNINVFDKDIYFRMKGENVKNLQIFLSENKFYQGPVTGYYGALTTSAVKKFQKANNIRQTGYFGPKSRVAAKKVLEDIMKQICGNSEC